MSELNVPRRASHGPATLAASAGKGRELPAAARLVAIEPHSSAYSPVVVAGIELGELRGAIAWFDGL